jgi:hypothetical protein
MSTVFAGLFFIILILFGFNVFVYTLAQSDGYNQLVIQMRQQDKRAVMENLVPISPGAKDFTPNSFNITVNNPKTTLSIARIYIVNISPIISNQCLANPCVVDPSPSSPGFMNGNIMAGEANHKVKVITGGSLSPINDGNIYSVTLITTNGRTFTLFYPWPGAQAGGGGGGGNFVTNVGPLSIYFDFKSFNFTQGTQTQSQPAWCVPPSTNLVFWVKIANSATDSSVTLKKNSVIFAYPFSSTSSGGTFGPFYVVDKATVNPSNLIAYNEVGNPYVLPPATANGPSAFVTMKFSANSASGTTPNSFPRSDFWMVFMGFSYIYRGQVQGQTMPFIAILTSPGAPGSC